MLIYLVFSHKLLIYNYNRVKLMQVFAIIAVVWSMLLTIVFDLVAGDDIDSDVQINFAVFQFSGWAFIFLIFFLLYRREPNVFLKPKMKYDVMKLFRFMFGKSDLKTTQKTLKKYREEYVEEE